MPVHCSHIISFFLLKHLDLYSLYQQNDSKINDIRVESWKQSKSFLISDNYCTYFQRIKFSLLKLKLFHACKFINSANIFIMYNSILYL